MKKIFLILFSILLACSIYSSEPKNNLGENAINNTDGTYILNHNIHTWTETNNSDVLVCKFCGEVWNLTLIDKIHRKILWFEAVTNIRLEIAIPILICIFIILIVIVCVIKSNKDSIVDFRRKANEITIRIKNDSSLHNVHDEITDFLLKKEISTQDDLDEVLFIYNDGNLKTKEEVDEYIYQRNLNKFDTSRHIVNFCFCFFPIVITFCLVFFGVKDFVDLWFIGIPLSLIPTLFISIITMIIGYNINISNAKYIYHLDEDEPSVQKEIIKRKMGIVSAIVSGVATIHNAKKGLKDIADVDSWKEMK